MSSIQIDKISGIRPEQLRLFHVKSLNFGASAKM